MSKTVRPRRRRVMVLEQGQTWKWNDSTVHIKLVGKTLVHYRHYSGGAKRPPILISRKGLLEQFLEENKARLDRNKVAPTFGQGGGQIQYGRKGLSGSSVAEPNPEKASVL